MIYVLTWIFTLLWIIPLGLTKTNKVSCPGTDYAQLDETCYYFYNNPKSWWQAQNSCEEKGGALLIFQERTEIKLVKKEVKKIAKELDDTVKFWLGLKHNSEDDKFYWADGTGLTRKNWIERLDKKVSVPGQCVVIQAKENSGAGSRKWETRSCDDKLPFICEIELSQSRWAVWSSWGDCSTSCDTGTKKRSRRCLRPTSASDPCKGSSSESKQCNKQECPATNVWSKWGDWGSCSVTCGSGVQTRRRSCKNNQRCSGEAEQERQCATSKCPEWETWSKWSSCSVTCGKGKKERSRTCLNSRQSSECKGNSKETSSCTQNNCPEWGAWSDWGSCSVTCGEGEKQRTRKCLNSKRGSECQGNSKEVNSCKQNNCPEWGTWSNWGSCSVTCGEGEKQRTRKCLNSRLGSECQGNSKEVNSCKQKNCPDWGTWSKWSSCSVTCGKGKKERSRTCLNSRQSSECKGNSKETSSCTQNDCPEWGAWSDWGSCSVTCGEGEKQRTRKCLNSRLGSECQGNSKEVNSCKQKNCPTWGSWTKWSSCSVTCGQGKQERTRTCLNSKTNKDCKGNPSEGKNCSTQQCRETKEKLKTKKKTKKFRSRVIRAKRNRGIIGYEIYRTQIKRVVRCALTCLRVSNCRSINFQFKKPKKKNGGETLEERVCILNSVSSTDQPDSIQELPGYKFYDLGEFFGDETDVG